MSVEFLANEDDTGLTVIDHIEGRRFPLSTPEPVSLCASSRESFRDPVDAAVSCRTSKLELPHVIGIFVRDATGEMVAECHQFAHQELPAGEYELEIAAPIKIFVRAAGPLTITSTNADMRVSFDSVDSITVGARSYHEHPAATITTTADPEDLMAAVSTFGSALKTTSPERSFPSLRGHPPAVELGSELVIPDAVTPPETELRIEVPRDRGAVYSVATLAHYLGARVTPGEDATLLVGESTLRELDSPSGLTDGVTATLKQVFLLDCIVRTEGRYQFDLHAREQLAERVDLPLDELYDAPIAERVARYLEVPPEITRDLGPTWSLSTHLSPAPESAELLPYAANALSLLTVERNESTAPQRTPPPGYQAFVGATASSPSASTSMGDVRFVEVGGRDALQRAWVGDGRSVNANDLHQTGVHNRLARGRSEGPIEIALVCNDEQMAGELEGAALYGYRTELPFDVTVHWTLSCDELRALLAEELDFLHYVGHVERAGFVCQDGALDAETIDAVGVRTFLLNGCRSYDQGTRLIEKGSIGGIVTHGAVDDSNATSVGRLVAGLLNTGYPLRSALTVAGEHLPVAGRYTVIGDGAVQIAQSEGGTPTLLSVSRDAENRNYDVTIGTYPTVGLGMGACYTPHVVSVNRYFLVGGELPTLRLSLPEVVSLLDFERVPAIIDGEFRWSTEVEPTDLP